MAKNYTQIVTGFTKVIKQCQTRTQELVTGEKEAHEKAAALISSANEMAQERQLTENLEKKLTDLIGG